MRQPSSPDPELVDYLKKNLKEYGADALRNQLISEGIPEEEIDSALLATTRKRVTNRNLVPMIVGGSAALTLLVIVVLYSSRPKKALAPVSVPEIAGQPVAAARPATAPPAGPNRPYIGHSNYVLQL